MTELSRYIASKKKPPSPPPARVRVSRQKRQKPMKRTSTKQAKLNRSVKDWRREFICRTDKCQVCNRQYRDGVSPGPLEWLSVHEIAKGPVRGVAMKHRACCLVVCSKCNCDDLCDYSKWPIERQLAAKLLTDAEYFDLDLFNKVRGRAATAITLADIVPYLKLT